ncbi:hypothetical protein [Leptospira interrogans]|uniref:hypothetical protein n=1 Tax=Leptospira interrogans TaxID=173 RepID=UPI00051332E0|nr:hypothetical protein [Leptospira interrogans]KAA1288224.1 hypothetical protein C4X99_21905 [Leptospira interrogans serovar Geyaweera]KGE26542.1 hypothetical protein IQ65_11645 [Leptospira interrogans serovar Lai]QCO37180.1 hypothetical protein E4412_08160 [Leptospira interrogans]
MSKIDQERFYPNVKPGLYPLVIDRKDYETIFQTFVVFVPKGKETNLKNLNRAKAAFPTRAAFFTSNASSAIENYR